jgi:hypothetical protein|tara:strand:- start:29 stop:319 length:291 start_codon:yes stop_codon:yes gene_type:complete
MVVDPATMLMPSPTPAARRIMDPPSENMTVNPVMMMAAVEISRATGPVREFTIVVSEDSHGNPVPLAARRGVVQKQRLSPATTRTSDSNFTFNISN